MMNADLFLWGFLAGVWATCLTILAVLEIRANCKDRKKIDENPRRRYP
jgi:hypothetical protein